MCERHSLNPTVHPPSTLMASETFVLAFDLRRQGSHKSCTIAYRSGGRLGRLSGSWVIDLFLLLG